MRDDFDDKIKETLARRVGIRCSNPNCQKLTSGPQTDPAKALNIGVAAHITAASKGGPRYDARLSPEERKSINNGIWLCQNCAKLVDNDEQKYTTDLLVNWKRSSEQAALLEVENPSSLSKLTRDEETNLYQNVAPGISYYIEYPIKMKDGKPFRDKKNPDIIVKNDGPIKAVSVTCDAMLYSYDEENNEIVGIVSGGFDGFEHLILLKELEPFGHHRQSWLGVHGDHVIGVYHIKVKYYRESDMKEFSQEQYFFIKQNAIVTPEQSKKDHTYPDLIKKIKSFDDSKIRSRLAITAAGEHTWFAESDGSAAVRIDPSGSLISQAPELQGDTAKKGYPFLQITPRRWKQTGLYIDTNITEDYIEVNCLVRLANTGESAAMLTENGFDIIETVPPGGFAWTTKTARVKMNKDSPITLSDYLKAIESGGERINWRFFVYYRPANKPDELLKVIFSYKLGKNDIKIIAPDF